MTAVGPLKWAPNNVWKSPNVGMHVTAVGSPHVKAVEGPLSGWQWTGY